VWDKYWVYSLQREQNSTGSWSTNGRLSTGSKSQCWKKTLTPICSETEAKLRDEKPIPTGCTQTQNEDGHTKTKDGVRWRIWRVWRMNEEHVHLLECSFNWAGGGMRCPPWSRQERPPGRVPDAVIPSPCPAEQLHRKPERTLADEWRQLASEHYYAAGAWGNYN